ncbi:MAG: hydroxyphenylacetyl-CoA thioesterase PaaI, partial [Pseudomonadota bacterium]
DMASQGLSMTIEAIAPGAATISMPVMKNLTNGHKTCHGGYIFTLADSAFAFACNTYNQNTVAQHCSVTFLAPGLEGDILTATAKEQNRAGRSGIYDVTVKNQKGEAIALFRGHSRTIKGQHFEEKAG